MSIFDLGRCDNCGKVLTLSTASVWEGICKTCVDTNKGFDWYQMKNRISKEKDEKRYREEKQRDNDFKAKQQESELRRIKNRIKQDEEREQLQNDLTRFVSLMSPDQRKKYKAHTKDMTSNQKLDYFKELTTVLRAEQKKEKRKQEELSKKWNEEASQREEKKRQSAKELFISTGQLNPDEDIVRDGNKWKVVKKTPLEPPALFETPTSFWELIKFVLSFFPIIILFGFCFIWFSILLPFYENKDNDIFQKIFITSSVVFIVYLTYICLRG